MYMMDENSILEVAKKYIQYSHTQHEFAERQGILLACVSYMIDCVPHTIIRRMLERMGRIEPHQTKRLRLVVLGIYGYAGWIQSLSLFLYQHIHCSQKIREYGGFETHQPAYLVFGEAVVHLALGVLATEGLAVVNGITVPRETLQSVSEYNDAMALYHTLYGRAYERLIPSIDIVEETPENMIRHIEEAIDTTEKTIDEHFNRWCYLLEEDLP